MNDKDPSTYAVPATEAETNHNQDPTAELRAISAQVDELLANDSEGKLKHAARDTYPNPPEQVTHQVGDRYGENVSRTTTSDNRKLYYVSYNTSVEPRQPDPSKPYYSPTSSTPTYFDWQVDAHGDISNFTKNAAPIDPEEIATEVAEVQRTITEGLDKESLSVDQYTAVDNETTPRRPARSLLGRAAALLGSDRRQG